MTFLERLPDESASAVLKAAVQAVALVGAQCPQAFGIGRTIKWSGRTFCEIVSPPVANSMLCEELVFLSAAGNRKRASIQVGCFAGEVFRTPPAPGAELAARIIDSGRQQNVRPFIYEGT